MMTDIRTGKEIAGRYERELLDQIAEAENELLPEAKEFLND